MQFVPVPGQSPSALHSTQLPAPSQTLPPESLHDVPWLASVGMHMCPVHALFKQFEPVAGQSLALLHATHWFVEGLHTEVVPEQSPSVSH